MVDVQRPRSSLPPPLLDAQSSFSAFTSDPQYWSSEHSNSKRRNISQDLNSISYVGAYRSSPPPAARTVIKEAQHGISAPGSLVLPLRDMHLNNFTAHHPTQYNTYIPAISALAPQTQPLASEPQSRASSRPPSGRHISSEETPTGGKHVVENPVFLLPEDASGKSSNGIVSYLQLPTSITESKGSLAEFAAQITCLFWFETETTMAYIEGRGALTRPLPELLNEAYPQTGFLKWVTTILSTTQVTQNVIILALLFIYRLKTQNTNVKGKLGSEYRLLTVALMLGNKFLDDNTYTNQTWAQVSGISVKEIHFMEVEFLSHLRYNLYTSKDQWLDWHATLAKYFSYLEQLSLQFNEAAMSSVGGSRRPSTAFYNLPSPPNSETTSPLYRRAVSSQGQAFTNRPSLPPSVSSAQAVSVPALNADRKRSYEESYHEPPQKRPLTYALHPSTMQPATMHPAQYYPAPPQSATFMPNLPSLPQIPPMLLHQHQYQQQQQQQQQLQYSLPQSNTAYLPTPHSTYNTSNVAGYLPPMNWPQSAISSIPPSSASTPNGLAHLHIHTNGLSDSQSRQPTPTSARVAGSATAYPSTGSHTASHTATPSQLSPSYWLTKRNSPYRPVRGIHTLLNPPPSASMNPDAQNISYDQMRWQPLGKNVEERPGRVPYMHREAWPQTNQYQHWGNTQYPPQG